MNHPARHFVEKVATVGIQKGTQSNNQFMSSMAELKRLVETAGGEVKLEFSQRRDRFVPATLIGKGKIGEIGATIKSAGIQTVIFDDDLTAAQQKNLEKKIPAKIIDRTRLILDIFAQRARSREGQLQVELAQLNYLVPRLTGAWRGFSQQVGGIGTRGPGERKIEVERRYVRERIKHLKNEIEHVRAHRTHARGDRQSVPLPQVALIGYTNVGKSTFLNWLVGGDAVYADDKLFATLDPTTRRVKLPSGRTVLFTDTVGFIRKLPHDLIEAFHATLEEISESELLIHVVDGTAADQSEQQKTVLGVLKDLKADHIPTLTAVNKADQLGSDQKDRLMKQGNILISAKTGEGMSLLLSSIEERLEKNMMTVSFNLPYTHRNLLADVYRTGHVVSEEPTKTGTFIQARIAQSTWRRLVHLLNGNS